VTEWPEFAGLNLADLASRMNNPVLIDGRNLFSPERAREAGFDYAGVGRAGRVNALSAR
jgi:UDPglucose 6-dehydrogenase